RDTHIHQQVSTDGDGSHAARLRVYRGNHIMYPHLRIKLTLDGVQIGALEQDSAIEIPIDPGRHVLGARSFAASAKLVIHADPGQKLGVLASFIYLVVADRIKLSPVSYKSIGGDG